MPSTIPRENTLDSTLALLQEGYPFIQTRRARLQSDLFGTRLMLREAICIGGEEAARAFYRPGRFTRRGAMPPTALRLLQDQGSVATLDGAEHHHRKAMFMGVMGPDSIGRLTTAFRDAWLRKLPDWERAGRLVLLEEARDVLFRAACDWTGVPLDDAEARDRARDFGAMIDGAGAVGPRLVFGALARGRGERWVRGIVEEARAGRLHLREGSPARAIVEHRDPERRLLEPAVAGVEIINLLRPTVAVDRYVMWTALALHEHPDARRWLMQDPGEERREAFVHEVRRFYPFFPFVGGRVLEPFEWRGHRFEKGAWVLLDLYGTNRDARTWPEPDAFRPERFVGWKGDPFQLVPQGGGDHLQNHRCAGEWATIGLMKEALRLLTEAMEYDVPPQDLSVDLSRMPAQPASRLVLANVRPKAAPTAATPT